MKLIDLLTKIANGEDIPLNIRIGTTEYEYDFEDKRYNDYTGETIGSYEDLELMETLNKEVVILDDLKECITCGHKDIEENMYETQDGYYCDACKD